MEFAGRIEFVPFTREPWYSRQKLLRASAQYLSELLLLRHCPEATQAARFANAETAAVGLNEPAERRDSRQFRGARAGLRKRRLGDRKSDWAGGDGVKRAPPGAPAGRQVEE